MDMYMYIIYVFSACLTTCTICIYMYMCVIRTMSSEMDRAKVSVCVARLSVEQKSGTVAPIKVSHPPPEGRR